MPVQKLNRAIKYRAYPTSEQQVLFAKTFGCVRFIWNHMLIDAQQFLDEAGTFFVPTPAKYKKEFPFLKEVDAHIGFHLANDIRNQSPASEVLLTLCGWNIDTLLDKTPPIAIED